MPTWGELLRELKVLPNGLPDWDSVRRKYLVELYELTGRPTIIYYTDWFSKGGPASSISLEDMQGMMEVCKDLPGEELDIIIHSPGGSAEATDSIVRYLRKKYSDIRVFVPLAAMSAATMWALSANRIVMGAHSQLGPIDPQFASAGWQAPARAILQQFERAKEECRDPALLGAWAPILQQYGPALIEQCKAAEELAKKLVEEWLALYMFSGDVSKASKAADFFADYETHKSHALGIDREKARSVGIVIDDLEDNQPLQDAVLTVHHATMHTFQGGAVKIVENHLGRAFAKLAQPMQVQIAQQTPAPSQPESPPLPESGDGFAVLQA